MSSKALLSVLLTASTCILPSAFHMVSTFKCNEEFPVSLLGVSDAQGSLFYCLLVLCPIAHKQCTAV